MSAGKPNLNPDQFIVVGSAIFPYFLIQGSSSEVVISINSMTIQEVAEYLKLNEKTAYRLASQGKIPGFKVGGSWSFKRQNIERWIE